MDKHKIVLSILLPALCVSSPLEGTSDDGPEYPCDSYSDTSLYGPDRLPTFRPLIIGHRGASGMFPEHTALAYREAAKQGADIIECDLAITRDKKFICSHEPYLHLTTDIGKRTDFADRKQTYDMNDDDDTFDWNDKGNVTDWFSFDFDLEELKTLKKHQSNDFRDPRYDGQETVVTLEELVNITKEYGKKQGRTIGIYPELKHSHAINKILKDRPGYDKTFEEYALEELKRLGFDSRDSPCYLQAFEISSLEKVRNEIGTDLKLVFLLERNISDHSKPNETWARLDKLNLAGVGLDKGGLVTPGCKDSSDRGYYRCNEKATDIIDVVHKHGWKAHAFTFRNEYMKLYWDHGQDPYSQMEEFLDLGLDGYFTDFPLTARRFLHYKDRLCSSSFIPKLSTTLLILLSFVRLVFL